MTFSFPAPKKQVPDKYDRGYFVSLISILNGIMIGKTNNTGDLTVTANVATTTVIDDKVSPNSLILLMPTTANAAAGLTATYIVPGTESFVVHHANNAQADRIYRYAIIG